MKEDSSISELIPSLGADLEVERFIMSQRYSGSFQLRLKRASRLPAYSRGYIKGDPVHLIDWKAFARNDQLIVREERDEASSRVSVCIDIADTMNWPTPEMGLTGASKWEIASRLAFHMTYVHLKKGDRVHLFLWNSLQSDECWSVGITSTQDALTMFHDLQAHKFDREILLSQSTSGRLELDSFQLCYLISDLLRPETIDMVRELRNPVRTFHVLSSYEMDIEWLHKSNCYFDESSGRKEFLGNTLRDTATYETTLKKWFGKLKKQLNQDLSDYSLMTDRTSIQQYLLCLSHPILEGG